MVLAMTTLYTLVAGTNSICSTTYPRRALRITAPIPSIQETFPFFAVLSFKPRALLVHVAMVIAMTQRSKFVLTTSFALSETEFVVCPLQAIATILIPKNAATMNSFQSELLSARNLMPHVAHALAAAL
jgi:hypothetical protein